MADIAKQHVLVIEDEAFIAMVLEDLLLEIGDYVVDVFARFEESMAAAREGVFLFAVLDVNLNGVSSLPIAAVLDERGIPFAFSTGYGAAGVDPAYAGKIVLQKPFGADDLKSAVATLLASR